MVIIPVPVPAPVPLRVVQVLSLQTGLFKTNLCHLETCSHEGRDRSNGA